MVKSIFKFEEKDSFIHKLDPRTKLFLLIVISIITIIIGNPLLLIFIFIGSIFLWILMRPSWEKIKSLLFFYGIICMSTMISQGVFYYWTPKTILITIISADFPILGSFTGGIYIYREGLFYGLIQSLRFLIALNIALLLITSTHPSQLILSLHKLKIPYELSFMITTAVRFAPIMMDEANSILNALRSRGVKINAFHGFKVLRLLFFPLLNNSLRMGRQYALAAEVRAFRAVKNRTFLQDLKFKTSDYIILILLIILLVLAIYLSLIGFGAATPKMGV
ncbi:MAG: energy-coupling factor transporter transmembrane component T family protein [Promethearchaeia archaeon]